MAGWHRLLHTPQSSPERRCGMANNRVIGGKLAPKGGRGGGEWRWGRGPRSRRGSGSDDASDEEYVVGDDGEDESSDDSYSSDASLEASLDAACSEDEEQDEEDEMAGKGEVAAGTAAAGRRRRGTAASLVPEMEMEEEVEAPLMRGPGAMRRRRPGAPVEEEGDECDDDDDEDFEPEEDDDDEEEPARAPLRKGGGGRSSPVKRRGKGRSRNSNLGEKRSRAPARKKRSQRRIVASSDDDDFVVKDRRISVEATTREDKKRRGIAGGRKRRRPWASRSDTSESDSSDLDYAISAEEARDLHAGRPPGHLLRKPLSSGAQGEKGKGKDDGDLGKQVCGICLSDERKGIHRGLLDCCAHYFCFACIMEWSKVESRCPLCKRRFRTVRKSVSLDLGFSMRTAVIKIPERDQVYQPSEEEIRGYLDPYANVVCVECQQGGDDNLMLLCDICDSPAHTYCAGLGREVPEGNWYCDGCRSADAASSNSQVQESAVEHRARSDRLQVNFHGEIDSGNASICMPYEPSQRLATLPRQLPSNVIVDGASSRHPSSMGVHGTALRVPGFTASTVLGRRSIHHRIRTMISNNRARWTPGVARHSVIQPSHIESDVFGYEAQQHGETFCVQPGSLMNGIGERSSRPFWMSRVNMSPCTHNEGSSCHTAEAATEFSQRTQISRRL